MTDKRKISIAGFKWLLYALIALFFLLMREQVFVYLKLFGAAPMFGSALCVCVAMFEGAAGGGLFGLFCGYLYFGMGGGSENLYAFVYLGLGALCGTMCGSLFRRRLTTALLWSLITSAAASLLGFTMFFLIPGRASPSDYLVIGLSEIIYSTAVTVLVYPMVHGAARLSMHRLD